MTSFPVGLIASTVGLGLLLTLPADAQQSNRQQQNYHNQSTGSGVTKWPQYTPNEYVVCWNGCNNSGTIVMGADPDPFIRSQILRDGSGFFGGGSR
jgi:hypothetical protein